MSAIVEVGSPASNRDFSTPDARCVERWPLSGEFLSEGLGMITTLLTVEYMGVLAWYPSLLWIRNAEMRHFLHWCFSIRLSSRPECTGERSEPAHGVEGP